MTVSSTNRPGLMRRSLDALSELDVGIKTGLVLACLGLLPALAGLLYLHQAGGEHLQNAMALYIAAFVLLFYPLNRALEELLVLRQTRRINAYVDEVKQGRRTPHFDLPEEKGNEHDFVRLKRNIFWMVQGLRNREARLQDTLTKLETAQRQVLESIEYASLIQRSVLPSAQDMRAALGEHFLFWQPRDGVGGDGYWVKRGPDHALVAVFDCTGHGVPGAFLTLIVNALLEQHFDADCYRDPALLLSRMNRGLKGALSRHGRQALSDDGLEGAVCCLDRKERVLRFAGARNTLLLAGEQGVREHRGDRCGVGFDHVPEDQEFATHVFPLGGVRAAYLFTDGVTDQVGGPKSLPFGRRRLHGWLENHAHLPMSEQHRAMRLAFAQHKGHNAQRDDVTVLGFCTSEDNI